MKIFFIPFWLLIAFTKSHDCLGLSCPSRCGLQEKGSQASLWFCWLVVTWEERNGCLSLSSMGKALVPKSGGFPGKLRRNSWRWPALYIVASFESRPFSSALVYLATVKHDYPGCAMVVAFTWSITVASWGSAEWKFPVTLGFCTCGIYEWQEIKALHCLWSWSPQGLLPAPASGCCASRSGVRSSKAWYKHLHRK